MVVCLRRVNNCQISQLGFVQGVHGRLAPSPALDGAELLPIRWVIGLLWLVVLPRSKQDHNRPRPGYAILGRDCQCVFPVHDALWRFERCVNPSAAIALRSYSQDVPLSFSQPSLVTHPLN
jgi:hypothetical protein